MTDTMTRKGFLKEENRCMLLTDTEIESLIHQMRHYQTPRVGKWIAKGQV